MINSSVYQLPNYQFSIFLIRFEPLHLRLIFVIILDNYKYIQIQKFLTEKTKSTH